MAQKLLCVMMMCIAYPSRCLYRLPSIAARCAVVWHSSAAVKVERCSYRFTYRADIPLVTTSILPVLP
jgi:hypothetical protein